MVLTRGWIVDDLEVLPKPLDDTRYEIFDGELEVSSQPSYQHQLVCSNAAYELETWIRHGGDGTVVPAPGVIFAKNEAVAPDVVWTSSRRLPLVLQEDGKFHAAPDLMIEVLSPGSDNESRDRETKLGIYSRRGVREYWIVDWRERSLQLYRHRDGALHQVGTLYEGDTLESPLLPGFSCPVARLFRGV